MASYGGMWHDDKKSLSKDGTIRAAPVLFRHENGQIIIVTPAASRKAKNVKRNEKVSVLTDTEQPPRRGVLIYGKELRYPRTRDEYLAEATRVYEKYMPRERAECMVQGMYKITHGVEIVVKSERIVSFDYSKDTMYPTA
jgi:nitroimidazol reductase NimA-like FMN-containing flavoprotein (pyridoxamine 5'-phosphate oxidase superfamily)